MTHLRLSRTYIKAFNLVHVFPLSLFNCEHKKQTFLHNVVSFLNFFFRSNETQSKLDILNYSFCRLYP